MKKILASFLSLTMILSTIGAVSASGCFHDHINEVSKAGYITQGANVRNIACMYGSDVIATLGKGTKVLIIGQTAWTKIVMPDGKVGRVGNNFVTETNDRSSVPGFPAGHEIQDYCDTTNLVRCPNPSPQGVTPTRYYKADPSYGTYTPPVTTPPTTTYTTNTVSATMPLSDSVKVTLDGMLNKFFTKAETKYSSLNARIAAYQSVTAVLESLSQQYSSMSQLVDYLKVKIEEEIAILEIQNVLNLD